MAEDRARILCLLREKTKLLSLQAYLIERGSCYHSILCEDLMAMFDCSLKVVRKEVNALLLQGLVSASWNEDETVLLLEEALPNRVEVLAEQLMEKVNELVESNEKVKDELSGKKKEEEGKMKRTTSMFGPRNVRSKVKVNRGWCVCSEDSQIDSPVRWLSSPLFLLTHARSPYQSVDIRDELLLLTDLTEQSIKDQIYACSNEIYGEVAWNGSEITGRSCSWWTWRATRRTQFRWHCSTTGRRSVSTSCA